MLPLARILPAVCVPEVCSRARGAASRLSGPLPWPCPSLCGPSRGRAHPLRPRLRRVPFGVWRTPGSPLDGRGFTYPRPLLPPFARLQTSHEIPYANLGFPENPHLFSPPLSLFFFFFFFWGRGGWGFLGRGPFPWPCPAVWASSLSHLPYSFYFYFLLAF